MEIFSDIKPYLILILGPYLTGLVKMGDLTCPICKLGNLTEDTMHRHLELHHTYDPNYDHLLCPICKKGYPANQGGLQVHFHNKHGPETRREKKHGPRGSITAFALVVCRRESDGKGPSINHVGNFYGFLTPSSHMSAVF